MTSLYTATAVATGDGRNGHVQSTDGLLDADVRMPVELGGPGGATNPEQLFAAGYAACFHSALKLVAGQLGGDTTDSEVVADVSLHARAGGGFGLGVALEVTLPAMETRGRAGPGQGRSRGLPLLQRHPRQHRGRALRRLRRLPWGPIDVQLGVGRPHLPRGEDAA
jgi:osmotically inducible protein OsmC